MSAAPAADPLAPEGFEAPWHAQLFALTLALSEAGGFTWKDWTEAFGAELARRGAARPQDGSDDYWAAWLAALEGFLDARGHAAAAEVAAMRDAWEAAYLATPHGDPVVLPA